MLSPIIATLAGAAPLALDALPAPAAYFSMSRRVRSAYTGPLFRLRNATTAAETDITTEAGSQYVDEAAILAHLSGGAVGEVMYPYDQSGNGRNMGDAGMARPLIATAGTIYRANTRPSAFFDSARRWTRTADAFGFSGNPACTIVWVGKATAGSSAKFVSHVGALSSSARASLVLSVDSTTISTWRHVSGFRALSSGNATAASYTIARRASGATIGQGRINISGTELTTETSSLNPALGIALTNTAASIGCLNDTGPAYSGFWGGLMTEWGIWAEDIDDASPYWEPLKAALAAVA